MDDTIHALLSRWGNFYLITGTAAAALTGLQFVVQTLIASRELGAVVQGDAEGGIAAFGSPTVVHFSLALLVSAVLCAPWTAPGALRVLLGLLGAGALVYAAIVYRRARRQRSYVPTFEDWLWHVMLPVLAYGAILVAALRMGDAMDRPLATLAGATLLLLCIGIHNAWDTVTYLTVTALKAEAGPPPAQPPRPYLHGSRKGRRR